MGRPSKPRQLDAANMIAGLQNMIADTQHEIEETKGDKSKARLNEMRVQRIKHYEGLINRLAAQGAESRPKQKGSRLILCYCDGCGYKLRTTMIWLMLAVPKCPQMKLNKDHLGCPRSGKPMEVDIKTEMLEEEIDAMLPVEEQQATKDKKVTQQENEEFFGKDAGDFGSAFDATVQSDLDELFGKEKK